MSAVPGRATGAGEPVTAATGGTAAVVPAVLRDRRRGRTRALRVSLVLAALVVLVGAVSLTLGAAGVAPADVLAALIGRADRLTSFVILELRLPRLVAGALVGACLGLSGALIQSVARNPLASPDIIGITAAASATGSIALIWFGITGIALSGIVLAGTLVAAAVIYLLAWRRGVSGYRFVLIGIGIAALCGGVVSYVLTRADITDVQQALVWLTGSLNAIDPAALLVLGIGTVVLVPAALIAGRPLGTLSLGDDLASGLGVRPERTRLVVVAIAVALAAIAVAVAGPISFVAFLAAPIARGLVGRGALALLPSALLGALILVVSDIAAQFAIPGVALPVGVVTGIVGAPYLLWLLARTNRIGRGG